MTNPPPPGWEQPGLPPMYGQGQPQNASWGPPSAQPGWGPPPVPPKTKSTKWLLIGIAVLAVIATSVTATLFLTHDWGDEGPQSVTGTSAANGDVASANDDGPIAVILEDPSCEPWRPIISTLAQKERQGWEARPYEVPASSWTPQQRQMFEDVAEAMREAADQTVALAKLTPHRVMRELYEQSIAYWRAYADSIPTYTERDNDLAGVATSTSGALVSICDSISQGSAAARGPLVAPVDPPRHLSTVGTPDSPQPFMDDSAAEICSEWRRISDEFDRDGSLWRDADPNIPATEWDAARKRIMFDVVPIMEQLSTDLMEASQKTNNAIVSDFAKFAAQYWKSFAISIPSYNVADSHLSAAAAYLTYAVFNACAATVGG